MKNSITQYEVPLNRRIHCLKKTIVPLEISTAWIDNSELLESCHQLHGYVSEAYDDMQDNPTENYIDSQNPSYNDTFGWADKFLDNLSFHIAILQNLLGAAYFAEINFIAINNAVYDKMYKKIRNHYNLGIKNRSSTIPKFEDMFGNLKRRGIEINRGEIETVITNTKYPKMFLVARMLNTAISIYNKKTKRTPSFGFNNLDFRFIENPFRKHETEDIFIPLTPAEEKITREIIFLAEKNNLEYGFNNKSNGPDSGIYILSYNKIQISSFRWTIKNGYRIGIVLPNPGTEEHDRLLARIDRLENSDEIKNFCAETISACFFCNKDCVQHNAYKMKWNFLGQKMPRLPTTCGGGRLRLCIKPDENNFDMIKTLIEFLALIYK